MMKPDDFYEKLVLQFFEEPILNSVVLISLFEMKLRITEKLHLLTRIKEYSQIFFIFIIPSLFFVTFSFKSFRTPKV